MKVTQLHADLGAFVIDQLGQLCELPSEGILAGGAVEAVLSRAQGYHSPINDVDLFLTQSDLQGSRFVMQGYRRVLWRPKSVVQRQSQTLSFGQPTNVHLDGYGRPDWVPSWVSRYRVVSVKNEGLLNEIVIDPSRSDEFFTPWHLISAFDLNCAHVAVDLATGKLFWDSAFEYFFKTRQLQVASAHSPFHTAVRCFKKLEQMSDVYMDVEATMQGLCGWVDVASSHMDERIHKDGLRNVFQRHVAGTFGSKYKKAFEQYETSLSPYFELRAVQESDALWTLKPKASAEPQLLKRIHDMGFWGLRQACKAAYDAKTQPRVRARQFFEEHFSQLSVCPVDVRFCRPLADRIAQPEAPLADTALSVPVPFLNTLSDAQLQVFSSFYAYHGLSYFSGQINLSNLSRVLRFCEKHVEFSNLFLSYTLSQQLKILNELKALEKEHGEFIYAYFENNFPDSALIDSRVIGEHVRTSIKRDTLEMDIKPLPIGPVLKELRDTFKLKGVKRLEIKELLTVLDLRREGAEQGHCVGGYASEVGANRMRIFSIRVCDNSGQWLRSTLAIESRSEDRCEFLCESLRIWEHRGRFNTQVSNIEEQIGRALLIALRLKPRYSVKRVAEDLRTLAMSLTHHALTVLIGRLSKSSASVQVMLSESACQSLQRAFSSESSIWYRCAMKAKNRPYVFATKALERFRVNPYRLATLPLSWLDFNPHFDLRNQKEVFLQLGPVYFIRKSKKKEQLPQSHHGLSNSDDVDLDNIPF